MNALFDPFAFSNNSIGFDSMFNRLAEIQSDITKVASKAYPPYNIKKIDDNRYEIEIAVAGFAKQHLDVEINDGTLVISGNMTNEDGDDYLHKGIATRAFTRSFTLADTVEIKDAHLFNGILRIALENMIPENKKPQKIKINDEEAEETNKKQFLAEKDYHDHVPEI